LGTQGAEAHAKKQKQKLRKKFTNNYVQKAITTLLQSTIYLSKLITRNVSSLCDKININCLLSLKNLILYLVKVDRFHKW